MVNFIESIKILNGRVYNIKAHNYRCLLARRDHFEGQKMINLRSLLDVPLPYQHGLVKCRINYSDRIINIKYEPYQIAPITSLKVSEADHVNYTYKYEDRTPIHELLIERGIADDILMVKDGLITDSSYGNVAFFDGRDWHTPACPLLEGTQRSRLIRLGVIKLRDIFVNDIHRFSYVTIFNAMIPFGHIMLSTDQLI